MAAPENWTTIPAFDLLTAIQHRKSHRKFRHAPLSLEELTFLLLTTQGIRSYRSEGFGFRTVPSAGCRHALETYMCVLNVEGIEQGILPLSAGGTSAFVSIPGRTATEKL